MSEEKAESSWVNGRQILFDFWEKLPSASFIETPREKLLGHKARSPIIRILRAGLDDAPPDQSQKKRRHALSAQEILGELQKLEEFKDIKIQSLYHHLDELEKGGLIRTVAILREKREKRKTRVAYYGRTARGFLFSEILKEEKRFRQLSEMAKLTKAANPEFQITEAETLLKRFLKIQRERIEYLFKWMAKNESLVLEHDADYSYVFDLLLLIDSVNPEYVTIFKKLSELLEIDLNKPL
ncbi:MAG: hypothetical protein ACFFGZ_18875 [Candidatus Thorarchaeota archaeon]